MNTKERSTKLYHAFGILHHVDRSVRQLLKTESSLSQRWKRLKSSEMLHNVDWYTVMDVSNSRVPYPQGLNMKVLRSFNL
jgi:hypothetical protein